MKICLNFCRSPSLCLSVLFFYNKVLDFCQTLVRNVFIVYASQWKKNGFGSKDLRRPLLTLNTKLKFILKLIKFDPALTLHVLKIKYKIIWRGWQLGWWGYPFNTPHPTPNNFEYKIVGQDKLNMVRMETMKAWSRAQSWKL